MLTWLDPPFLIWTAVKIYAEYIYTLFNSQQIKKKNLKSMKNWIVSRILSTKGAFSLTVRRPGKDKSREGAISASQREWRMHEWCAFGPSPKYGIGKRVDSALLWFTTCELVGRGRYAWRKLHKRSKKKAIVNQDKKTGASGGRGGGQKWRMKEQRTRDVDRIWQTIRADARGSHYRTISFI